MSLEAVYKVGGRAMQRIARAKGHQELTGSPMEYTQIGKPHTATYDFAERMLRAHMAKLGESLENGFSV